MPLCHYPDEAPKEGKSSKTYLRKTLSQLSNLLLVLSLFKFVIFKNISFDVSAESFVGKALVVKGIRRHARKRIGEVRYGYIHYFVRLEEGNPPEHYYYWRRPLTIQEKLDNWIKEKRERTIEDTI